MADEKEIHLSLTPKQIGAIIVVVGALANGGTLANFFNPSVRADPFTGKQGEALTERVDLLEIELMEFEKFCEDRYDKVSVVLENHTVNLRNNREMITDCLRRTQ